MAEAATVNVACKLPSGLRVRHKGVEVSLKGSNGSGNRFGFGITPGVDAAWFKDWIEGDGKDLPAVKRGSIFAIGGTREKAEDAAAERRKDPVVQTGLEPLDPEKPGGGVEPTDETKTELAKAEVKDFK